MEDIEEFIFELFLYGVEGIDIVWVINGKVEELGDLCVG